MPFKKQEYDDSKLEVLFKQDDIPLDEENKNIIRTCVQKYDKKDAKVSIRQYYWTARDAQYNPSKIGMSITPEVAALILSPVTFAPIFEYLVENGYLAPAE